MAALQNGARYRLLDGDGRLLGTVTIRRREGEAVTGDFRGGPGLDLERRELFQRLAEAVKNGWAAQIVALDRELSSARLAMISVDGRTKVERLREIRIAKGEIRFRARGGAALTEVCLTCDAVYRALIERDSPEEAVTVGGDAVQKAPDHAAGRFHLCRALMRLKRAPEAQRIAEDGLAIAKVADLYSVLGESLRDQGKLDAALKAVDDGIAIEPTRIHCHIARLDILEKMGRKEEALAGLTLAVERAPEDPNLVWRLVTRLLPLDVVRAEAAARRLCEIAPEWWQGFNDLGYALEKQGRLKNALLGYQIAHLLAPTEEIPIGNVERIAIASSAAPDEPLDGLLEETHHRLVPR